MITICANPMQAIRLGRVGENERLRVAFDVSALLAELPGAAFTIIKDVAKAEFYSRVSAFLSANNRAMWTVTLTRADGRQIMRETFGAFPDMTPEPEPEPSRKPKNKNEGTEPPWTKSHLSS